MNGEIRARRAMVRRDDQDAFGAGAAVGHDDRGSGTAPDADVDPDLGAAPDPDGAADPEVAADLEGLSAPGRLMPGAAWSLPAILAAAYRPEDPDLDMDFDPDTGEMLPPERD